MTKFKRYDSELSRRRFIAVATGGVAITGVMSLGLVLGGVAPPYRLTPGRLPAVSGDFLVHAASDRLGEPVAPEDVSESPIRAWPAREVEGELLVKSEEPNNLLVVLRPAGSDEIVALSAICTHLGCQVNDNSASQPGTLLCPCHSGLYRAESGEMVSGPQPRGLPKLTLAVADNRVNVSQAFEVAPYGVTDDWETLIREAEQA